MYIFTKISPVPILTDLHIRIEPIVSALHTRSYPEAESEQNGSLLDPVAPLLRSTVDEIRRLDGSQAVRSIICSLLSALSRFMDEDICTMYVF